MASIKKKSSGGGGANWMDTYGDMVTLLLCFFVLLYSISTVDQSKWMLVVQSFNKDALDSDDISPGPSNNPENLTGGNAQPFMTDVEQALDDLYEYLLINVAEPNDSIDVTNGDGYVFISFAESVFFAPDSSVLLRDGQAVLDDIIPALRECGPSIDELKVIGHTAQARADSENNPVYDRQLASLRATEVVIYLQQNISHALISPGRLVPQGAGQWRNIANNNTPEGKARNRRVEMIITGKDLDGELAGEYERYETMLHSTGKIDTPE